MHTYPQTSACLTAAVLLLTCPAKAGDWSGVPLVDHSEYQAVNADGSSAYSGGFPKRLIGVALNNTEDCLDPTPAYTADYQAFAMGGQAEVYVQSVEPEDFGGTSCWMGQNYGNLPWLGDPSGNYTDTEWTAELNRLQWFGGDAVAEPIRAGDLVEIRARAGLHYKGKMNVNEQHQNDPAFDFEIVVLQRGYGLPNPTPLGLASLKTNADEFIFDSSRQSGGERHQSTRVRLCNVWTSSHVSWTAGADIDVTDGTRTLTMRLGRNPAFDGTEIFAPGEPFDATGILDQSASNGTFSTDGYCLLVMHPSDFEAAAPKLTITREGGEVVLQWPDNATFYELQSCPTPQGADWIPVNPQPQSEGGIRAFRESIAPGGKFFRLQKQ